MNQSISDNLEPVVALLRTLHSNVLRQKQDIHSFVFNHQTENERVIALMELISLWNMPNNASDIILCDETSELFSFSAAERRHLEYQLMEMTKEGDFSYPFEVTSLRGVAYGLLQELIMVHQAFGHTGRADAVQALYLFDRLDERTEQF